MLREAKATLEVIGSGTGLLDVAHASSPLGESAWSSSVSCFMGDADGGDDHLSIELNSLLAMLDGNPESSRICKDELQANQIDGNHHFERTFTPEDGAPSATLKMVEEAEGSGKPKNFNSRDSHSVDTCRDANCAPRSFCLSTYRNDGTFMTSSGCPVAPSPSDCSKHRRIRSETSENYGNCKYERFCDAKVSDHVHDIPFEKFGQGGESERAELPSTDNEAFILSSRGIQRSGAMDSSHFLPIKANGYVNIQDGFHAADSPNADSQFEGLRRSASYSSDDPGSVSASLLHIEFDNDEDREWMWNSSNDSRVNMKFSQYCTDLSVESSSKHFLPDQLSQSFTSCNKKDVVSLNNIGEHLDGLHGSGNSCPQDETFSGPMFDSYLLDSDSSISELTSSGTKKSERINLPFFPPEDSFSLSLGNGPSKRLLPNSCQFIENKKQRLYMDSTRTDEAKRSCWPRFYLEGVTDVLPVDQSGSIRNLEDDPDVYIIDDVSNADLPLGQKLPEISQVGQPRYGFSYAHQHQTDSSRLQSNDDKLAFKIALQDLAQPKVEAIPPEGVLSVPLLRHQRIALSWMVQKETLNHYCSGGILADDQGLGKTVSTIALILMERSPRPKSHTHTEVEALTLDDDDGEFVKPSGVKQESSSAQTCESSSLLQKGRPAAGTLVVCPTSVLRQWAEELKQKVTSKANLSFMIYHGSNRTRDPSELVKYDVVLTTYSIVSMEVPTWSKADESNTKRGGAFALDPPPCRQKKNNCSRKRKDLSAEDVRPLAKVGWFRVILDEAQTIKNHRTQVARACWGLRAKRRWCLSGTPIQNAVDDLYSYFRFLRYEPFATYTVFCSKIKMPINRDPSHGYRKLQALLKTVMLRRTKGTLLDGKPIINLPPRTIKLKKVDFSKEERDFYSRLEAESREKFKGYADAGTVKQNYVNILLMLLRLRQACDHPLLVKGYDSSSIWKSSIEAAKKVPRDKQIELLNCLESSLALCTLCNDPPEDAVVTICGHVFCNQCISEHLTGDEDQCPSAKCKAKLAGVPVFSKLALKSCLAGLPGHDLPETTETADPLGITTPPGHSSKIRAAVEILQSLPPSNDASSTVNGNACCPPEDSAVSDVNDGKKCDSRAKVIASEKAIVFSQWTRMLDLLEVKLKSSSLQYRRLDGTMSVAARDKAVKDFNTLPEVTVMIMSLKAASLGLNMVAACHVLLLDLWWNPTTEDQAIDRAHRIGQTRPVTVSRLTVENTVEDRILALQEKKREMVASAFGEDGSGSHQSRLTLEDLRYLFRV